MVIGAPPPLLSAHVVCPMMRRLGNSRGHPEMRVGAEAKLFDVKLPCRDNCPSSR